LISKALINSMRASEGGRVSALRRAVTLARGTRNSGAAPRLRRRAEERHPSCAGVVSAAVAAQPGRPCRSSPRAVKVKMSSYPKKRRTVTNNSSLERPK